MTWLLRRWAMVVLAGLALFAIVGPLVWSDPIAQELGRSLDPPTLAEPLGRDHLGRSVVARLAHASRLSILLAVVAVTTALVVGTLTGILAAWRGRLVDTVLHGLSEALIALPALLLVLVFAAMADGGPWTLYVGLALAQWVEYFRVTRARSGLLLAGPAVEAASLLQLGPIHVLRRHLWPDLRPLLATMATFGLGTSILALSTLGFVGVGVSPPTPELGLMITEAFPFYDEAPRLSIAPVLVLGLLMLGLLGLRAREETP
ncbi:ABC transporter permease [Nitriliruptor alkaliphilus]|uniref:ABC transporter permease n=1 Tax=Nitriliruptor alkaliphilus TaxID=427918 RepID=UPI00069763C1|nr:ABC transporter permease subunit [Nitriliruptor alkaliphilus]